MARLACVTECLSKSEKIEVFEIVQENGLLLKPGAEWWSGVVEWSGVELWSGVEWSGVIEWSGVESWSGVEL